MKTFYGACFVLGTILPYSQLVVWLDSHGADVRSLLQAITGNPMSAFAWLDVLVSAIVLLAFIVVEGRRLAMRHVWVPIVGTLTVGVSCGLPLFLLMREQHLHRTSAPPVR